MESSTFLFLTANIGSLFGKVKMLQEGWFTEVVKVITKKRPLVLAFHFQEVGGKEFKFHMEQMKPFIRLLYDKCSGQSGLNRGLAYVDEDFSSSDTFTALGTLYLFHDTLPSVEVFNFSTMKFEGLEHFEIYTESSGLPFFQKKRFLKDMFPKRLPSRKGFLRCHLKVDSFAFDLVNVHLFHDSCNIAAVEMSPSVFAKQRECGLKFIMDQINKCLPVEAPLVIFGDFNFRLDTKSLVENLLAPPSVAVQTVTQGDDGQPRVQYKHVRSGENLVDVRSKVFNHTMNIKNEALDQLFKLDREPKNHLGLREFPINFLPSYPFMEDIDKAGVYMNTRAPAWCDRVFLNDHAWRLAQLVPDPPVYDLIGKDTCMGDHKPVYLWVCLSFVPVKPRFSLLNSSQA
ncbi:endonuclease/exonuclease/phosphatase family protein [Trichuris suis]|nr:endonuclease/exonuclease/phosphatase family protein [Trichuris suis]